MHPIQESEMPQTDQASHPEPREASRRRDTFHHGFGQEGDFAADVLRDCLIASHGFVAEIVSQEAADTGFDAMIGCLFEEDVRQHGWEGALHENDGMLYSELAMGQVFHDLNAYRRHRERVQPIAGNRQAARIIARRQRRGPGGGPGRRKQYRCRLRAAT
jgi:hypothetical protein